MKNQEPAPAAEAAPNAPTGISVSPRRWTILAILLIMAFMATLDSSIVNIALPVLSNQMNEPISAITWIVTSYLVVVIALVLFLGRLGDIKGNTTVFRYGIIVFTIGSLLCGVSVNLTMLVISRVLQAVGAAAGTATSQGIITQLFPPGERGRALGFNGAVVALGSLIGPPLGGLILAISSWHYIFMINVPIGIVAFIMTICLLPKGNTVNERMDIRGAVLFGLGIALVCIAIGSGENAAFSSPLVIAELVAGIILIAAFILSQRRQEQPLLDLSIFRNVLFSISLISVFLVFISINSINILQPFYLQDARGLQALTAGLLIMVYPVVMAVSAPLCGYLADRIGQKLPVFLGLWVSMIGYAGAALMTVSTSLVLTGFVYGVLGLGNALFAAPNTSLVMSSVPRDKVGVAGGVNSLARNTGITFGVLLATTILFSSMSARYGQHVNDYVAGRPDLFIYGMRVTYLVMAGVCFVAILLNATQLFTREKT